MRSKAYYGFCATCLSVIGGLVLIAAWVIEKVERKPEKAEAPVIKAQPVGASKKGYDY